MVFMKVLQSAGCKSIYGSINGIEGVLGDNLVDLCNILTSAKDIELLKNTINNTWFMQI